MSRREKRTDVGGEPVDAPSGPDNAEDTPDDVSRMEAEEQVGEPSLGGAAAIGPTTSDGPSAMELDVVRLLVEEIMPDPLNPNVESPETFNMLVSTISEDGFDQPVVVCALTDYDRQTLQAPPEVNYVLAKGEHRWRAARVLGLKTIPAVIRTWDGLTRRTRLVRDNTVKGELDKNKFTELVHSLQAEHSLDSELASSLLGFDNSREMFKQMVHDHQKKALEDTAATDKSKGELKVLDDLSLILNTLFTKHGHTLPYGYMMFMWGGKISAMVEMDDELQGHVDQLAKLCLDRKVSMSLMLSAILRDGMAPYRAPAE